MRMLRGLLAALVAAPVLVMLGAAPASACSCLDATVPAYAARADVVLVGRAESVQLMEPSGGLRSGAAPVAYRIAVDRVYKGAVPATVEVYTAESGAACGMEVPVDGGSFVVFATRTTEPWFGRQDWPDGLSSSLCSGNVRADDVAVAEVEQALGNGSSPTRRGSSGEPSAAATAGTPARSVPVPVPEGSVTPWAVTAVPAALLVLLGWRLWSIR